MRFVNRIQLALWLALGFILLGSLKSLAWSFSTLDGNDLFWGYIKATGVDVGLLVLAYSLQVRRVEHRPTWTIWLGIALFSGVSFYGNWLYAAEHAKSLTTSFAWLRPLLLGGVLPVMVLYLSEVVSSDVQWHLQTSANADRGTVGQQRPTSVQTSSDKTFVCDACGETFGSQRSLGGHKRWCKAGKARAKNPALAPAS